MDLSGILELVEVLLVFIAAVLGCMLLHRFIRNLINKNKKD